MSNTKMTKRALLTSVMALMLCFAMLTGTTFAWFTDQETSANNKIIAGNLDIQLLMFDGNEYVDIGSSGDPIFGDEDSLIAQNDNLDTLWEPGKTQIAYLAIRNAGNLAIKYDVKVLIEDNGLVGALEYAIVPMADAATASTVLGADWNAVKALEGVSTGDLVAGTMMAAENGRLDEIRNGEEFKDETDYFALAIHMKESADNIYMSDGLNVKSVKIDIIVDATQVEAEEDAFGDDYDMLAKAVTYDAAMGSLYDVLATIKAGTILVIPEGTYETTGTLKVAAGVTIVGADGANVVFRQNSSGQDDVFNCMGDATFKNLTIESNRKGYAIADNTKNHDTDFDITVVNCNFKGIATEKNYGVYKPLNGNLTIENCTFDNYNNAVCGVNNANGTSTVITGCTFTNINGEAIGYVSATVPADFEENAINNNTGLTAENVIGY